MNWQPGMTLEQVERIVIEKAIVYFGHNKTRTAHALGIAIRTLDSKLDKFGIACPDRDEKPRRKAEAV